MRPRTSFGREQSAWGLSRTRIGLAGELSSARSSRVTGSTGISITKCWIVAYIQLQTTSWTSWIFLAISGIVGSYKIGCRKLQLFVAGGL
ncbi:hypothetical protein M747DRAFT_150317 [Aspergillus niger ATCC 13496]|uniref:Uncharacterized protein n=1 Tax=Aspergillus niger ATCC 13496 TaxID=1353008 RepID=A0A370C8H8_ASPNG|nr:hypothetical protein M747DRAFT_150317 [Aspergillus niger ATCC 13496]